MVFDTYASAQRLKGAGFNEAQVDAVTTGLSEIAMARIATKEDIERIEIRMSEMEQRLSVRTGVIGSTLAGLIVAAVKLL